jgi:hypothetical protein
MVKLLPARSQLFPQDQHASQAANISANLFLNAGIVPPGNDPPPGGCRYDSADPHRSWAWRLGQAKTLHISVSVIDE